MSPKFDIKRPLDGLLFSIPNTKPSVTFWFAHANRAILVLGDEQGELLCKPPSNDDEKSSSVAHSALS
jgi:hypothetical protein